MYFECLVFIILYCLFLLVCRSVSHCLSLYVYGFVLISAVCAHMFFMQDKFPLEKKYVIIYYVSMVRQNDCEY